MNKQRDFFLLRAKSRVLLKSNLISNTRMDNQELIAFIRGAEGSIASHLNNVFFFKAETEGHCFEVTLSIEEISLGPYASSSQEKVIICHALKESLPCN